MPREAFERDEFRTPCSPPELRVVQVTNRENQVSWLRDQNALRWTPDSKRFAFFREVAEDKSAPAGYWLCDADDGFAVSPIVDFVGFRQEGNYEPANGRGETFTCQLIPDGSGAYQLCHMADKIELRRLALDGSKSETLMTAPAPLATRWADVSADGERLAFGVFLGDGKTDGAPWGTRIFDVKNDKTWVVELGNQFRRAPGKYTLNPDPKYAHLLTTGIGPDELSDGSWLTPPDGAWRWQDMPPGDPLGGGTLVYHDDGTRWGIVPLGRDGVMRGSHSCWRGREFSHVASMYHTGENLWRAPLVEAKPMQVEPEHYLSGTKAPGAKWVDLTRFVSRADSCHFNFDAAGRHFISDTDGYVLPETCMLYVGTYVEPQFGDDPYVKTRLLGIPRTSWRWKGAGTTQASHPHAMLSPDGKYAVFQSDFSGCPQVHVAYDFEFP